MVALFDFKCACDSTLVYVSQTDAEKCSPLRNFKFGIYFHKKRMGNFHYDIGIKSRPGSQIFPTLAILVARKLRIFHIQNKQ